MSSSPGRLTVAHTTQHQLPAMLAAASAWLSPARSLCTCQSLIVFLGESGFIRERSLWIWFDHQIPPVGIIGGDASFTQLVGRLFLRV